MPRNATPSPIHLSERAQTALTNRRTGIEPLIGHIKHGGQMGRSRMKTDRNVEASAYAAVIGFNLRQMTKMLLRDKMIPA